MIKFLNAIQPISAALRCHSCTDLSRRSAAADWLSKAFGFGVRLHVANHRIQMKAGDGCFTIAEGNVVPNSSHIVQVRIEDVKGHCERARQNGAIIVTEPQDSMASGNTILRVFMATIGISRKLLPMSLLKEGRCISSGVSQL